MEFPPHLAQFRRLLHRLAEERQSLLPQPFQIAPEVYADPARARLELDRLFQRLPLVLGHDSLLPRPGDVLTMEVAERPLLLARGRDGRLRGFLNACRHRGVRLLDSPEPGRKSALVCPYHNWNYDLTGRLQHVPCLESFPGLDPANHGLTPIPLEVRHGLIWGIPGAAPELPPLDLDGFLHGIGADLDVFGFAGLHAFARTVTRRRTNWKLIMDAFLESYHVVRLHHKSVGPFFQDGAALVDSIGPHIRAAVARQEFAEIASLPESAWDARRHASFAYLLYPNTTLVLHPDYTSILSMYPVGAGETDFVHVMLTPQAPQDEKQRAHWQRSFDLVEHGVFQGEDLWIAERIQASLGSGANRFFTYGQLEYGIKLFHQTLDRDLGIASIRDYAP